MRAIARHRDEEAVVELRGAVPSPTNGFARVNYELRKALLRLNRAAEAVPVVRAALPGDIDGSHLYMTRTDLHEVLGKGFERIGARSWQTSIAAQVAAEADDRPNRGDHGIRVTLMFRV